MSTTDAEFMRIIRPAHFTGSVLAETRVRCNRIADRLAEMERDDEMRPGR